MKKLIIINLPIEEGALQYPENIENMLENNALSDLLLLIDDKKEEDSNCTIPDWLLRLRLIQPTTEVQYNDQIAFSEAKMLKKAPRIGSSDCRTLTSFLLSQYSSGYSVTFLIPKACEIKVVNQINFEKKDVRVVSF